MKWQERQHVTTSFTATELLDWLNYLVKPHPLGVLACPQKLLSKFKGADHLGKSNEKVFVTGLLTVLEVFYLFGFL